MNFNGYSFTLPQSGWEVFERSENRKTFSKGEMIYLQGQPADRFFYLKNGSVKVFLSSGSGMEKTLTILAKESIFGEAAFFDGLPRVSSAKALIKSEIVSISKPALMEIFQKDPSVAFQMLQYLAKNVRMLSAQVDNMTFLQADKRIAQLLLRLAEPQSGFETHCTHEELGSLAGTSRVTVSRILNDFAHKGWVSIRYRAVKIENVAALAAFAE